MREKLPRESNKYTWSRIGYQPDMSTTERAVWNGASDYVFPTVPMRMELVSSSANDTNTAGTGARTVKIYYLDSSFNRKEEVIALNGTGVVPTVADDIYRINYMRVLTTGSGNSSAGVISLRHLADTPVYCYIAVGDNVTKQMVYTVPAGATLYIDDIIMSSVATTALKYFTIDLKSSYCPICDVQTGLALQSRFSIQIDQATLDSHLLNPMRFPATTDIVMKAIGLASGKCTVTVRGTEE